MLYFPNPGTLFAHTRLTLSFIYQETALNAASSGVLNFFALLRLLKLLRIIRAARIFERYDTVFLTYHAQVSMTKLLVVLCLLSHW